MLLPGFATEEEAMAASAALYAGPQGSRTAYLFGWKSNLDTGEWALIVPEDSVGLLSEADRGLLIADTWVIPD